MSTKTYANYREIPFHVIRREEFNGNSMSARQEGGAYRIYSYDTVIAEFIDGAWFLNSKRYSVTTSRQQNILRTTFSLSEGKELVMEEHGWEEWR